MKGQTLIEVVVVIALVVVLVTGIVSGTTSALNQNKNSQLRTTALQYAQEGIEIARFTRDQGWDSFALLGEPGTIYCVGSDRTFIPSSGDCGSNILGTPFSRDITLTLIPSDTEPPKMVVIVTVGWGADLVTLTTSLSKI